MSIVTIQIGQCGNQIGEKLFETISSDCFEYKHCGVEKIQNNAYVNESKIRFFTETDSKNDSLMAKSVLIDMESKVVNKLVSSNYPTQPNSSGWKFRANNSYTQKKGSGNNWSYGYCLNGPKSSDKIEQIIRLEAEKCDRLSAFHVCMSLAGGTGSGVGTYYSEFLKNTYPRTALVNTLVWPFSQGEVILQNYNLLLTLNKLYECSDALILLENDNLHQICKRIQVGPKKEVTFDDLNSIIGHKLASILQPATDNTISHNYLDEIISDLCSHTSYKLLSLSNVPQMSPQSIEFSSFAWPGLYKNLRTQSNFIDQQTTSNKSLAMCLFARGGGFETTLKDHLQLRDSHFDCGKNFGIVYTRPAVRLWHQPRCFNQYEKSLSVLSNSQSPAHRIEQLLEKAWKMFKAKAYVHQYTRYANFEEENLLNALVFAEQLVKNYKKI